MSRRLRYSKNMAKFSAVQVENLKKLIDARDKAGFDAAIRAVPPAQLGSVWTVIASCQDLDPSKPINLSVDHVSRLKFMSDAVGDYVAETIMAHAPASRISRHHRNTIKVILP